MENKQSHYSDIDASELKRHYSHEEVKQIAEECFVKGWHKRVGEDELSQISERTARNLFNRWWSVNHE